MSLRVACHVVLVVTAELVRQSYWRPVPRVGAAIASRALVVLVDCVELALGGRAEIVGTHFVQVRQVLWLHIATRLQRSGFNVGIELVLKLEDLVSLLRVWLSLG